MALLQPRASVPAPPIATHAFFPQSNAEKLPYEVIGNIMGHLEPSCMIKASQTCCVFRTAYIYHKKSLWRVMAFNYPLKTLRKYFEYAKWITATLRKADDEEMGFVQKMPLPCFYNGKLNKTLIYEQEQIGVLRLQWEMNRMVAISQIRGSFIKDCKEDYKFTLFAFGCHLDDLDANVWGRNMACYSSEKSHEEEDMDFVTNDLTIDLMIKLKATGWIKGIMIINEDGDYDSGPDGNDTDDNSKMYSEIQHCITELGIDWLGGLYKGMKQFKKSPFPNGISNGNELVQYSTPVVARASANVDAFLLGQVAEG